MSALFHLYLCGRIAAEWWIFMKKAFSVLAALLLLFSLAGCQVQGELLDFLDEFQITDNRDVDGTIGLTIPANLPLDAFDIRITGTKENGETVDFSTGESFVPGETFTVEGLLEITSLRIEICLSEDGEPALVWDLDFPNHDFSRQRLK